MIWRYCILPLISPQQTNGRLRIVNQFTFNCIQLPHFFHSYFMTCDFVIFRQEEVYQILIKIMQSTQHIIMKARSDLIPQLIHGLVFDCSLFLPGFRDLVQMDPSESTLDKPDSIFSKIAYILKREISTSTVSDHQNSLIYNIRENSIISDFFDRLSGLIISMDEIYLCDLVCRLNRFAEEMFDSICHTGIKLMASHFKHDASKVMQFMNVYMIFDKSIILEIPADKLLMMCMAYSMLKIFKDKAVESVALRNHIKTKIEMDVFDHFCSAVKSFTYTEASSTINSMLRLKPLAENRLMMEGYLYEASIHERQLDFIRKNILLIVDANCMANTPAFFDMIRHLCNQFRQENDLDSFVQFLNYFKSSIVFGEGLKAKIPGYMAWRCFIYLKIVAENSDIHLSILQLFADFVRYNFRIIDSIFGSNYLDRIGYLSSTLTTVARELSLSSHSSLADALKSFMNEDEDMDASSPKLKDNVCKYLDNFNLTFMRKPAFTFEDLILDKAKVYSEQSILDHLRYLVDLIISINIAKTSFRLMIYLLEYSVDLVCRKESKSIDYFNSCLWNIDRVFDIENMNNELDDNEREFKAKFRAMKDGLEISTLLRSYFKFRICLKAIHSAPVISPLESLQDQFSAVSYASTPYMALMITIFENSVKQLLFKLSLGTSAVSSWQTIFKLLLFIKRHATAMRDRMDSTDDSLARLEAVLSDVSSNIKVNPTNIDTDIIFVNALLI